MSAPNSIAIIGAGGHGRVVADILDAAIRQGENCHFLGFIDDKLTVGQQVGCEQKNWSVIGQDADIPNLKADGLGGFCMGIGLLRGGPSLREQLFFQACKAGLVPQTLIHPSAILAPDVIVGQGTVIMAGAVINTGAKIGENSIINTGAILDHDAIIGDHVHVAPGCKLSGNITVGDRVMIGTGATVIQGIDIGKEATVGAGSVVIRHVPPGIVVKGVPAQS